MAALSRPSTGARAKGARSRRSRTSIQRCVYISYMCARARAWPRVLAADAKGAEGQSKLVVRGCQWPRAAVIGSVPLTTTIQFFSVSLLRSQPHLPVIFFRGSSRRDVYARSSTLRRLIVSSFPCVFLPPFAITSLLTCEFWTNVL